MFMRTYILILSLLVGSLGASQVSAPANIFASGNNKFVLPILIESFYRKYPDSRVVVQYGATGDLANSILNGVNYDIFLAADMKYPQKIYEAKKSLNPPVEYARGFLILFVPADKTLRQRKLTLLRDAKIQNITIANKKTAPYGMAAVEALKNANLLEALKHKIRYSTDISTAITNVVWYDDAGFLSKSAFISLPTGYKEEGVNWIEVDKHLYSPIIQGYVISKSGAKNMNAERFLEFIFSKEGRDIYKSYGYE
jgi:molybdate transport system substrate-binding protein